MAITIGAGSDAWGIWHGSHPAQIPWQRYLDEAHEAGYRVVEPGNYGYLPTVPAALRRELEARDLHIPGGSLFGAIADREAAASIMSELDRTAGLLSEVGADYLVVMDDFNRDIYSGAARGPHRLNEAGWAYFVDMIHRMAHRAREAHGMTLVFHPHCDAMIEEESEIERFLALTDPYLVGLCMDTGHHVYCGGDPIAFWLRHHSRMPYLHIKSMNSRILANVRRCNLPWGRAVEQGVTDEPALGIVDMPGLVAALRHTGYHGYAIVEQDMFPCDPAVPLPLAQRTITYLRSLGFVT
jgi:inosose dehydratase